MSENPNQSDEVRNSAGRTIARNTAVGVVAQLGLKVAGAIFQIYVVRQLGGANYGQYSSMVAWTQLFAVLGDMGVAQYLAREIARDHSKIPVLFWDTVSLRLILAVVAIAVTTLGAALWGYSSDIILATVIFTSSYIFQAILAPLTGLLIGHERVDIASIVALLTQVVFYIFAALFLILGFNFVWLALAGAINIPIMVVITWWFVRRNNLGPPRFHINPQTWPMLFRLGFPFALIQLSLSFSFRVDTVFLSRYVSDEQIGWYSVAYNLIFMITSVVYSFSSAILPTLARQHAGDPESIKPWYYHSTRMLLFLGLPVAFCVTVLADKIIHFLYQPQIGPAAIPLMILIWDIPIVMYNSFCGNITQSMQMEDRAARVFGSLGISNILLNLILIPTFGIIGASFATVLTDVVGVIQFYSILRRQLGYGLRFGSVVRLTGAAFVTAFVLYLLPTVHVLLLIAGGGVLYLVLVWFSGAFSDEERTVLVQFVRRKLPRLRSST